MIVSLLLSLARGRKRRRATPPYLIVSPISHDFGMNTGSVEILVDSSSDWTATGVPSDFSMETSGGEGQTIITLTRTSTSLGGTATITFTNSDGETATFAVTRTATYLTLSPTSYDFGTNTGEIAIVVNSSSAWTVTGVPEDMALSVLEGGEGQTEVSIKRTDYDLSGTAVITFKNDDGNEATFTVTRTAKVAVLVNASDSSDVHGFDSCEEAATYLSSNSGTTWDLIVNSGEVPDSCFASVSNLRYVTFNEGVTSIGTGAFAGSGIAGSLVFPEGLTSIGMLAFSECGNLTGTLSLPSTLQTIEARAFYNCNFTGSLTIPARILNIGLNAFYGNSGFDDDLSFLGTSEPNYTSLPFLNSSFTQCKVPSEYTNDTFCGLPVVKGGVAYSFEFTDSSLWVDNVTNDVTQGITSNTIWALE